MMKLTIWAFHYKKKAIPLISTESGHYSSAARLRQIVISLKRLAIINIMKLNAMIDTIERYSIDKLDLPVNTDLPYITCYKSSQELIKSNNNVLDKPEYVQRALSESRLVKHPDDVVGMDD